MAVPAQEMHDDGYLVRAVQAGDLEAFSVLFRRHHTDVLRSCTRRMACPLEAEEVAQAAFVRALERIGQCTGERHFGGWVQIIARHMCVDALRTRSRVVPSESPISEHHADGSEPHDSILDRERSDDVRRALDTLPLRQRQAITARALGTGPVQIADDLGLSVGAVDSLILRGRRRLALAYRRVAGEGGSTATATSATAAASLLAALCLASTRLLGGVAAAAEAGRDLVRPVASGMTGAIMAVAVAFTGSGPADGPNPSTSPPDPSSAVVVKVPFPDAPFAVAGTGASDTALFPVPSGVWSQGARPPAGTAGAQTGLVATGVNQPAGTAAASPPAGTPSSTPTTAALPVDVGAVPVLDSAADVLDATLPAVTDTVGDTTVALDDVAQTTVVAVSDLLPK